MLRWQIRETKLDTIVRVKESRRNNRLIVLYIFISMLFEPPCTLTNVFKVTTYNQFKRGKKGHLWIKAGWLKYCTSLFRFPPPLSFSWWLCVRLCKNITYASFFPVFLNLNTFLLWLLACCCVVTCKAKVCHIQTYNKQAKFMRTHAHAHARTPKGLSLKAIPLTWPDHKMYINVSDKHLQRSEKGGRKSGGPGKSVRLKMRRGNTKRFNSSNGTAPQCEKHFRTWFSFCS